MKIFSLFLVWTAMACGATSVSQYGITWTWKEDRPVGQYVTGGPWVQGPITITSITPASTLVSGRTKNGSMVNPAAKPFAPSGFDSTQDGGGYKAELNAARPNGKDLSASNPLVLQSGSSLVSAISVAAVAARPQLSDAAVLTVIDKAPPAGSFRPPYCGADKMPYWNAANLNYSILSKFPVPSSAPAIEKIQLTCERPWIEIDTEYHGRELHPSNNQPIYGRDMADALSAALLSLHLNYTDEQKAVLYQHIVQYGIDVYGAAKSGGIWSANGGHNMGRKMPLILAGLALGDKDILSYVDASKKFIFQEDQQSFVVDEAELKIVPYTGDGRQRDPYTKDMLGTPEWGEKHPDDPKRDGSNWGVYYRNVNYPAMLGSILAARLTAGAMDRWNRQVLFDYYDRVRTIAADSEFPAFSNEMWNLHRTAQKPSGTTLTITVQLDQTLTSPPQVNVVIEPPIK